MASRKNLKKAVKNICGELFADCVALSMCQQGGDEVKLHELMSMVMVTYQDYVSRISHTEKGNEKTFYKTLRSEFTAQVNKISEEIVQA